jgi:transcriptional regulator with XRE-family HTH domain
MTDTGQLQRESQGATLRRLRRWLGLSQREVATALGVSDAAYGFWEAGKTELRLSDVRRLAQIFEIPFATLLRSLGYEIEQDAPTLGTWMERSADNQPGPWGDILRQRRTSGRPPGPDGPLRTNYGATVAGAAAGLR